MRTTPQLQTPPDWPSPEDLASMPHPHPSFRRLTGAMTQQPDGSLARWVVARQLTYAQVIEEEAEPTRDHRPSVRQRFDPRGLRDKLQDWAALARARPMDALVLPFIDRYPPMVTWTYDDSADWSAMRWPRALQRWHEKRGTSE